MLTLDKKTLLTIFGINVLATDREHAIKIANEKRMAYIIPNELNGEK